MRIISVRYDDTWNSSHDDAWNSSHNDAWNSSHDDAWNSSHDDALTARLISNLTRGYPNIKQKAYKKEAPIIVQRKTIKYVIWNHLGDRTYTGKAVRFELPWKVRVGPKRKENQAKGFWHERN